MAEGGRTDGGYTCIICPPSLWAPWKKDNFTVTLNPQSPTQGLVHCGCPDECPSLPPREHLECFVWEQKWPTTGLTSKALQRVGISESLVTISWAKLRSLPVLVVYCCITNFHLPSGLKQQIVTISQSFCALGVWAHFNCVFCSVSYKTVIKVLFGSHSHLEAQLGKNSLPSSFMLWRDWGCHIFPWGCVTKVPRGLLAVYWRLSLGPRECPQFLAMWACSP